MQPNTTYPENCPMPAYPIPLAYMSAQQRYALQSHRVGVSMPMQLGINYPIYADYAMAYRHAPRPMSPYPLPQSPMGHTKMFVNMGMPAWTDASRKGDKEMQRDGDMAPEASLVHSELWEQFHTCPNEMIISKRGRCMFPIPSFHVRGLELGATYSIHLEFVPSELNKVKFVGDQWVDNGSGDKPLLPAVYVHPDSPNTGWHFMRSQIVFDNLKLTNKFNHHGHVLLNTFHKYKLRLNVVKIMPHGATCLVHAQVFPLTEFVAVTSYANEKVKALKIDHNPFARAFKKAGLDATSAVESPTSDTNTNLDDDESEAGVPSEKRAKLSTQSLDLEQALGE